jgi:putative hemolysin
MEAVILFGLILINGFFSMSEISLVTARRARLQRLIDAGDRGARIAVELGTEPTKFLSTVQIGITSVALLSGIVGEATFAPPLAAWLMEFGMTAEPARYLATGIVVALVTFFTIVVGELVPKRLGQTHAEKVARLVARPIRTLAMISKPFVWLLSVCARGILRLLFIDDSRRNGVTEEEIRAVLTEGSEAGVIEKDEHRMMRNVLRFDDLAIVSFMTPRADIVMLEESSTRVQQAVLLQGSPHSHYPVARDGEIVGVVSAKDMLVSVLQGHTVDLASAARPAIFFPKSISGLELLEHFRKSGDHQAMVVDEYGTILGLITLHDLLEAITGAIRIGGPEEDRAVRREDGSWSFDGQISIHELYEHLGLSETVDPRGEYQTLSGLIIDGLGHLPAIGERVARGGWVFEVADMDGYRIDRVLVSPGATAPARSA